MVLSKYLSKWKLAELKEYVLENNIRTGWPSGKWGGLIKHDYIAPINRYPCRLPPPPPLAPKSIIPCEWHLIGKTKLYAVVQVVQD